MTTEHCTVFVQCIPGVEDLQLSVPMTQLVSELKQQIKAQLPASILPRVDISTVGGISINKYHTVEEMCTGLVEKKQGGDNIDKWLNLRISIALCGGKGGFGTLLKQSAGKMNKKGKNMKSNSKDLYKTLDGRKVKAIKRIKQLEERMEQLPEEERKRVQEKKEKLQRILDIDLEKNVKFEDTQFLEDIDKQMEEIRAETAIDSEDDNESDESETDDNDDKNSASSSSSISKGKKKKFTKFFDEDEDDMKAPKSKSEGKKQLE